MAFLNLENAFDNVSWNIMFPTLEEVGFEWQDLKILHSLYKHQIAEIKIWEATANARIKKGLWQGCTLSPPLFNYFIENIINIIKIMR